MSKSKSNKPKGFTVETLQEHAIASRDAKHASLLAQAGACEDASKARELHVSAAELLRVTAPTHIVAHFNASIAARDVGLVSDEQLRDAWDAFKMPRKGFAKLAANLLTLANGTFKGSSASALHMGFIHALSRDWVISDDMYRFIANYTCDSVSGTAPTQRSSSAASLRALGIIEESKQGKKALARWADTPAANAMREALASAPSKMPKGSSI